MVFGFVFVGAEVTERVVGADRVVEGFLPLLPGIALPLPASISARRTHLRNVSGCTPIRLATWEIDSCPDRKIRTASSRYSGDHCDGRPIR